ncbi:MULTISPECIES: hypothetical protein [Sorangium]|uniref:hypothetical protein n=1 Tax=Sorangium TaxID=39643 RepID=UPI003D9C5E9F
MDITFPVEYLRGLNTQGGKERRTSAVTGARKLVDDVLRTVLLKLKKPFAEHPRTGRPKNRKNDPPEPHSAAASIGGVNITVSAHVEDEPPRNVVLFLIFYVTPARRGRGGLFDTERARCEAIQKFCESKGGWYQLWQQGVGKPKLENAKSLTAGFRLASPGSDPNIVIQENYLDAIVQELQPLLERCVRMHHEEYRRRYVELNEALPPLLEASGPAAGDGTLIERVEVVEALVATMLTRPLVLLAGVSGSGKTQLACRLGKARASGLFPPARDADDPRPFVQRARDRLVELGVITKPDAQGWLSLFPVVDAHADGTSGAGTSVLEAEDEPEGEGDVGPVNVGRNAGNAQAGDEVDEPEGEMVEEAGAAVETAATKASFELVPVRPDWHEAASLWGWREKNEFHGSPALRVVLDAWQHWLASGPPGSRPPVRHVLVLDEMNLSRIEHYGSDLLSAMEQPGRPVIRLHDAGEPIPLAGANVKVPPSIGWPPGLCIIGTVNVDETTFAFAPKVLDRASVLEFVDVDLQRAFTTWGKQPHWQHLGPWLTCVQEALRPHSLHFGYRAAREIVDMIETHLGEPASWGSDAPGTQLGRVLDRQLLSKGLPRVRGPRGTAEPVLLDLLALAVGGTDAARRQATREQLRELAETGLVSHGDVAPLMHDAAYPLAAAKARAMLERLNGVGFTGYF